MALQVYTFSDKGGRRNNEDCVGYRTDGTRGIFVIADGLGGHASGEVASRLVVADLIDSWSHAIGPLDRSWLRGRLEAANRHLVEGQASVGPCRTTVVALVVEDGRAFWAHAGDTRLYHIHGGRLVSVTRDHSVAYVKYCMGEITRSEIATDPDQPRLLRALGDRNSLRLDVDGWDAPIDSSDSFFLCTDGAWEYLNDDAILIDRLKSTSPDEWARHCLLRILGAVGEDNDNLSVIAVTVQP